MLQMLYTPTYSLFVSPSKIIYQIYCGSFYLSLYLLVFINLTSSAFAGMCALDNVTSQIGSYDNDSDLALFFAITRG